MRYKRVLIKLSGGAIADATGSGFDQEKLNHIADEVLSVATLGVEVAIVVGGGNIFRGGLASYWGIERVEADQIGTLGTVINSLMLRGVLNSKGDKETRVMTSVPIPSVGEPYIRLRAAHHLNKGYIVIFAGGNGQPYVTTDYPAVQRALEMECDAILIAKHGVDGVYNADPKLMKQARKYVSIGYDEAIRSNLKVMDQSALILARDHGLKAHLFNFDDKGSFLKICQGEDVGTLITEDALTVLL
ncbi:UMP kinase [Fictibacillus aquaticus]|uniref:Uridylate kinase n=2 Tax=Fictibacillus aquaticus TaxID=2021314 RepID=A0A235F5L8_9BACL|nr:UMP kinase [Fictibacillus aquaticus]OYD56217.1 UMP kinase [Fictibacillus aquaticus]